MELLKDKLVLEKKHQVELLEAASVTLSKKNMYRYSNIIPLIKSIGDYIDGYYSNKHERLCAYSISTAIKQALATMCKYEPDLFTKIKGGKHDKR